jgi:outer membrane receptor protein involved in Fe transport
MLDKRLIGFAIITTSSLCSNMVFAQDAASTEAAGTGPAPASQPPQSTDTLQEVIVTAEKRSERLRDVPMSITAVTGSQLQDQGITSPADLTKVVPGFTYTQSTYGAPVYTLRGIGTYDEAIAISPAVGVYSDQIPLPFARMTEGVSLDLQRVEVLKGPQGTLFGENSTGGAVNYIPNRPTDHFAVGGAVTYGRFDETDVEGFVSGPVSSTVNARVAVRTEQRGDWQYDYTNGDQLGARHFTTGRLLVDFAPTDTLKWSLNVNGWYDRSDAQAMQKIGYAPLSGTVANPQYPGAPGYPNMQAQLQAYPNAPANDRAASWDVNDSLQKDNQGLQRNDNFYQAGLRGDWQVSDHVTVTSLTGYSRLSVETPADSDGTTLPDIYDFVFGSVGTFTQELRAAGQAGDNDQLKWMTGVNYEHDNSDDNQFIGLHSSNSGVGPFRFTGLFNINQQVVNTEAVFGSLDYKVVDTLTLQGSVRYTNQTRGFHGGLTDDGDGDLAKAFGFLSTVLSGTPTVIPPGGYITLDQTTNKPLTNGLFSSLNQDNVSWKIGPSWKPSDDVLLYANASKGYKAGAFGTLPVIRPAQDQPVVQESVLAYEIGFKTEAFAHRAELSGAVFDYNYDNKQLLASKNVGAPFGTLPGLVNIPRSRIEGAELDATVHPWRSFTLRAGGSYLDSKVLGSYVISSPVGGGATDTINIGGEPFPATPKWQLDTDAEYDHPLANDWTGFIGAADTYQSTSQGVFGDIPLLQLPSYSLLDLRAGISNQNWHIELWGRNVTDRYYLVHAFRSTDTITRTTGMPATFGITVRANF